MRHISILPLALALALAVTTAMSHAATHQITLPADTSKLRPSALPGYSLAQQKCGICHSANYISYQPPGMTLDQWTAEMTKMQHSYGAPINEEEVQLIGAYLAVEYGSAEATDPAVLALSAANETKKASEQGEAKETDIQALLGANACLGCHAIDTKIVGPSFHEVAAKYLDTDNAQAQLARSIQNGGAGKWGAMPMPPMGGLSDEEARALAAFVLEQ
jgi:cytochrome c551/c552